ncbi:MAG: hypothetical protein EB127_29315 [Alphaproteobacteria bacterium]|nr:hypothetical protein [Alphaproteobacteria bacterium]
MFSIIATRWGVYIIKPTNKSQLEASLWSENKQKKYKEQITKYVDRIGIMENDKGYKEGIYDELYQDEEESIHKVLKKIVELTSAIESQTYKVRRSEGMTAQEAKKEADTEAQFAAIDFGRMQTYIDPANAKIIAEAVGRVLDSIVGKMSPFSEGGPRKPGYFDRPPVEKAPIPEPKQDYTGQRLTTGNFDPNDIVTPARIVEKFTLEAEAAGMTLDKLTDRIKKFTADTAIAYKQTVTKQQKSAGAAISTATDVRSDESIKRAQSEVTNLFQAFDSNIPEERMGQIMNQLESGIKSGMNFDQIKSSIPELDSIIREVIDNHKALGFKYSFIKNPNVPASPFELFVGPLLFPFSDPPFCKFLLNAPGILSSEL